MIAVGAYLALRRRAAGLTIADVATMIAANASWRGFNADLLRGIEAGAIVPSPGFVDRLRGAFAFDRFIVRQLVCAIHPAPELCRVCGCSALDACDDEQAGPCGWASTAHDLCTHCAGDPRRRHHEEKRHA